MCALLCTVIGLTMCTVVHTAAVSTAPDAPDPVSFLALLRWVRFLPPAVYKLASYMCYTGDELWHDELALCPHVSAYG